MSFPHKKTSTILLQRISIALIFLNNKLNGIYLTWYLVDTLVRVLHKTQAPKSLKGDSEQIELMQTPNLTW